MQVSPWGIIGFYLWLSEAAVVLIAASFSGAQKRRPELTLVVAPLLIVCPLVGLSIGTDGGTGVAVLCALAATWLPLLGVALVPARHGLRTDPRPPPRSRPQVQDVPPGAGANARMGGHQAHAWGGAARQTAPPQGHEDDPYSILGLSPGASRREIKAAWRRRAAESHPDKVAHLGPEARQAANETMARINRAYETLRRSTCDP